MFDDEVRRQIFTSYACVFFWMVVSGSVVLHNKWLLSTFDFHYPSTMTMFHMGFSFCMALLVTKLGPKGMVEVPSLTARQFCSSVLPIGVLYAVMLVCSNYSYLYLSVALIQMVKASLPVLVFGVSVLMGILVFDVKLLGAVLFISFGVSQVALGQLNLHVQGFILQISALCVEACRLVLIEILLKQRGINLNALSTVLVVCPTTFLCLTIPVYFLEGAEFTRVLGMVGENPFVFLLNCGLAFLLNIAVFLLIGKTSALTMNIAGIAKDTLVISVSQMIFESKIYMRSVVGFAVAIVGVAAYNYFKLQVLQAKVNKEAEKKVDHTAKDVQLINAEEGKPEAGR
eukprot:TRINITY_DN27420_c0_g1_i1.p1 TRINITY_DN27420_c0_g1~~TRINITY_DN27420_c0_g1_i1.p1  ORF type:complete len:343 (-),score=14.76 TRINITY_DN27420_c0_g1_i1:91-1119(-)